MSRQAIAAVLAREDLASGERLAALSLASFADRSNRAWPGAPAAAARAGLGRSRYLHAREQLVARGLIVVDERASGRGRSSTIVLRLAETGPWWDGEINVELFEDVLGYSKARGPARLLVATMAAVSDADGVVRDLSTDQVCAAAGVADRTYRRARGSLLDSGELVLVSGIGGRGNTNVWAVPDPRLSADGESGRVPQRVAPPAGARPLVASIDRSAARLSDNDHGSADRGKGGQDRTVAGGKRPALTGVSATKSGQHRTLFELPAMETPAERAAETQKPRRPTRAREANPRTPEPGKTPPNPPLGGARLTR